MSNPLKYLGKLKFLKISEIYLKGWKLELVSTNQYVLKLWQQICSDVGNHKLLSICTHFFYFNSVRPVFQNLAKNTSQEYMFVEITKSIEKIRNIGERKIRRGLYQQRWDHTSVMVSILITIPGFAFLISMEIS